MRRNNSGVWAQVWAPEDESKIMDNLTSIQNNKKVEVQAFLMEEGLLGKDMVEKEVAWFFGGLGLTPHYFVDFPAREIADHVRSLYAAKLLQVASGKDDVRFVLEREKSVVYVVASHPGDRGAPSVEVEHEIGAKYLKRGWRAAVHRSTGPISEGSHCFIRIYVVEEATFERAKNYEEGDIRHISNDQFLRYSSENTRGIYGRLMERARANLASGPIIEVFESTAQEKRLVVMYYHGGVGTGSKFFSGLSSLYRLHSLTATRKYVEFFNNGYVATSIFLRRQEGGADDVADIAETLEKLRLDANLVYVIPCVRLLPMLETDRLNVREAAYAYCAYSFARHFVNRLGPDYWALKSALPAQSYDPLFVRLRSRLLSESLPKQEMFDAIVAAPALVRLLYSDFALRFRPEAKGREWARDTERLGAAHSPAQLRKRITEFSTSETQRLVFDMFVTFNEHVRRTNFYKEGKMAMAFRLDPGFLDTDLYPARPFAVNFVIGSLFRGFHVRFRDVARGGIRLIVSRDSTVYHTNIRNVFDECYNLALTQQKKNKDIPEGGSKGALIMRVDRQSPAHQKMAFYAYIDANLDLQMPDSQIVDRLGRDEWNFYGPDENTAGMMDWAAEHAKRRGAQFWRAITTGKSRGGIPHDVVGATTSGVNVYYRGILAKLGLEEKAMTRFQAGGPDGDLSSNAILTLQDKTMSIVCGTGVAYDPNGLDREELLRLARARLPIRHFDRKKLSPRGFLVDVEDADVTLPDGTVIERGVELRNRFHLTPYAHADVFIPCGGRPAAVDLNNVNEVLSSWKVVVEGANLFFTQPARLKLEEAGVVLVRDASANKSGVGFSSREVLVSLALGDEEFRLHFLRPEGSDQYPEFYAKYVADVKRWTEENARLEFECLWAEHEKTGEPISSLSGVLSDKINDVADSLRESESLWKRQDLRVKVLKEALPPSLVDLVGLDAVLDRVPDAYLKALWAAHLASRFVYRYGLNNSATEIIFFEYLIQY